MITILYKIAATTKLLSPLRRDAGNNTRITLEITELLDFLQSLVIQTDVFTALNEILCE
jgi:hypothetical protein